MCKELQEIIESEELILDSERLTVHINSVKNIEQIINEFRHEFIDRYDNNNEYDIITIIYKFTEELKKKLHK